MTAPSIDKAKPAPRENHTEKVSVLSPASLGSLACFHLFSVLAWFLEFSRCCSPSKSEHADVKAMKEEIKGQLPPRQLLTPERPLAHGWGYNML